MKVKNQLIIINRLQDCSEPEGGDVTQPVVSDGSWDSVSEEGEGEGTADVSRKSKSRRKRFNSEVLANDRKKMQSIPQIKASEYVMSEYQNKSLLL